MELFKEKKNINLKKLKDNLNIKKSINLDNTLVRGFSQKPTGVIKFSDFINKENDKIIFKGNGNIIEKEETDDIGLQIDEVDIDLYNLFNLTFHKDDGIISLFFYLGYKIRDKMFIKFIELNFEIEITDAHPGNFEYGNENVNLTWEQIKQIKTVIIYIKKYYEE